MTSVTGTSELATEAEEQAERYVSAFNAGNAEVIEEFYTEDAISVWEPGNPLTGQARKDSLAQFLTQKPTMRAVLRESHVTSAAALLVVDWQIDFTDENGQRQHLEGVGLDVMRRGADGVWRFAIDNPFGG